MSASVRAGAEKNRVHLNTVSMGNLSPTLRPDILVDNHRASPEKDVVYLMDEDAGIERAALSKSA